VNPLKAVAQIVRKRDDYRDEALDKYLASLTPEELEALREKYREDDPDE
jgi:hypothetical protein